MTLFNTDEHIERIAVYHTLSKLSIMAIMEVVRLTYKNAVAVKDIKSVFGGSKSDEWHIKDSETFSIYSACCFDEASAWKSALRRCVERVW